MAEPKLGDGTEFKSREQYQCRADELQQCPAAKRIHIILKIFHKITKTYEFIQLLDENEIFIDKLYTSTQLLNDFNHIKYFHGAEDVDDLTFFKMHQYFTNDIATFCDPQNCKKIEIYSRARQQTFNVNTEFYTEYLIKLISRIHVYFIHPYDINRMTPKELEMVKEQIDQLNLLDEQEKNDKEIELITVIISKKKKKLNIAWEVKDKYIEGNVKVEEPQYIEGVIVHVDEHKHSFIDFEEICQGLKNQDVKFEPKQLRSAFMQYEDQDKFISDIIDAYCVKNNQQLPFSNKILTQYLPHSQQIRREMYGCILKTHIKPNELNQKNFIKIAQIIIKSSNININMDEFIQKLIQSNISGKMFNKGHHEFKNSLKFAKLFKSINGYKKNEFRNIYVDARDGKWIKTKQNENKSTPTFVDNEKEEKSKSTQSNFHQDSAFQIDNNEEKTIYTITTR
eukprot:324429_1